MTGETITVVSPGSTTDARGNTVADWSDEATSSTTYGDALWAPRHELGQGEDHTNGRQGVVAAGVLYLRPGAVVAATDRVIVRGLTFEVDGEPGVWDGGGVEVPLRRTTG